MRCGWSATQPQSARDASLREENKSFCACTVGGFWKDAFMAEAMADNVRQNAPQNFLDMSVPDCLLLELANIARGQYTY